MATMSDLELGLEIARQQVLGLGHPGYKVLCVSERQEWIINE